MVKIINGDRSNISAHLKGYSLEEKAKKKEPIDEMNTVIVSNEEHKKYKRFRWKKR